MQWHCWRNPWDVAKQTVHTMDVRDPLSINYAICVHDHSWWEKGRCNVISHLLCPFFLNLTNYTENRPLWQIVLKRNLLTAWVGSALGTDTIPQEPINPCRAGSVLETSHIFAVFTNSKNQDGADSWNSSLLKTRTYLSYVTNIIAADGLVTQGARASTAVIFTKLLEVILIYTA